ncbi:MAG TPA: acylphosphatase [Acidobacteria bacterium]|nr:acylphosphatase [Acidobacteriota bacterium]HAK56283.1 acylphosphatase [Acidobacteriota bacterium]
MVARRYIVRGRVQGVGFRFFTEDTARQAGVHGHVSNRDDGSVEVVAEGDIDAVARLEAGLRQGPPGARVDTVEVEERVPAGVATGFSIETGDAWI